MLQTLAGQIGALIVLGICGFAFLKGDRTEQWGAGVSLVAWLATLVVESDADLRARFNPVLAIDLVMLAAFAVLAWKSERSWPIWAAGFQGVALAAHLAHAFGLRMGVIAYFSCLTIAGYGVLVAMGVGTFIAWREREALKPPQLHG